MVNRCVSTKLGVNSLHGFQEHSKKMCVLIDQSDVVWKISLPFPTLWHEVQPSLTIR